MHKYMQAHLAGVDAVLHVHVLKRKRGTVRHVHDACPSLRIERRARALARDVERDAIDFDGPFEQKERSAGEKELERRATCDRLRDGRVELGRAGHHHVAGSER